MLNSTISALPPEPNGITWFLIQFLLRLHAVEVWGVDGKSGTDREIALEGLARMEAWMKSLGVAMNLTELGVKPTDIDAIADGTLLLDGGYKKMTRDDLVAVLKAAL